MPVAYYDTSYVESIDDRRSTRGHVFLAHGTAICRKSRKQSSVSKSTTEAEYVECSESASEAVFLRMLAGELRFPWPQQATLRVGTDSQGAKALVKAQSTKCRTKHIDIHYHYVREPMAEKKVDFEFVGTDEQVADFLTKPLPRAKHEFCINACGLS